MVFVNERKIRLQEQYSANPRPGRSGELSLCLCQLQVSFLVWMHGHWMHIVRILRRRCSDFPSCCKKEVPASSEIRRPFALLQVFLIGCRSAALDRSTKAGQDWTDIANANASFVLVPRTLCALVTGQRRAHHWRVVIVMAVGLVGRLLGSRRDVHVETLVIASWPVHFQGCRFPGIDCCPRWIAGKEGGHGGMVVRQELASARRGRHWRPILHTSCRFENPNCICMKDAASAFVMCRKEKQRRCVKPRRESANVRFQQEAV